MSEGSPQLHGGFPTLCVLEPLDVLGRPAIQPKEMPESHPVYKHAIVLFTSVTILYFILTHHLTIFYFHLL